MAKRDPENKTKIVILGGGSAGATAAETLRQSNFTGEIMVISKEDLLPYDRTLLPKTLSNGDVTLLRNQEFFDTYDINYKLNSEV